MEIEAKFAVPNRAIYRRLARLRALAGYVLRPAGESEVADRYFDTADGRLLAAGFACRLRMEGDVIIATLKGLGGAQGAVHRRAEEEVRLPRWEPDPAAWPESPARSLALELTANATLQPLFDLHQRRLRADLCDGAQRVAQLSLDRVRVELTGLRRPGRTAYYELEVELTADGREADLAAVVAELTDRWALPAESRSKFERGLALWRQRLAAEDLGLTAEERQALTAHAAGETPTLAHRALAVLGWADGLPLAEIAARSGLSVARVRYWVRAFRARRLDIFSRPPRPFPMPDAARAAPEREHATEETTAVSVPPSPPPTALAGPMRTVNTLCAAYEVDMAHARCVAQHAARLFEALRPRHKLPRKHRKLLRHAAWLYTVGATSDRTRPHAAGRDIILAAPLHKVSTTERLMLACIVAFAAGKLRAEREPTMAALDEKAQRQVLVLAALARIAEALDSSRTQRTEIVAVTGADGARCEITLAGPAAEPDAAEAGRQAEAWRTLLKQELIFRWRPAVTATAEPAQPEVAPAVTVGPSTAAAPSPPAEIPPLAADDPMSEAGRKVLAIHFGRMLANEPGTRLGEDPEALHDMRVATRRMRAAFALFEPYYEARVIRPLGKGLRRAGRTLGAVRDLDVLLEKARAYVAGLPAENAGALDPLLEAWSERREAARRQMLDYLDSSAYRRLVTEFSAFLTTPGAGAIAVAADAATPYQVRHVIPGLILERYASVRAYERLLPDAPTTTYHALRIECKRLRYALEFFREVLGEETPALIKQITAMQDLLGELQDACVAAGLLTDFLDEHRRQAQKRGDPAVVAGIEAYLAAQQVRQAELLASFGAPWAELIGPEFRRRLALAIAAL